MKAREALKKLNAIATSERHARMHLEPEAQGIARPDDNEIYKAISEINKLTVIVEDALSIAQHALDTVIFFVDKHKKDEAKRLADSRWVIESIDRIATHAQEAYFWEEPRRVLIDETEIETETETNEGDDTDDSNE